MANFNLGEIKVHADKPIPEGAYGVVTVTVTRGYFFRLELGKKLLNLAFYVLAGRRDAAKIHIEGPTGPPWRVPIDNPLTFSAVHTGSPPKPLVLPLDFIPACSGTPLTIRQMLDLYEKDGTGCVECNPTNRCSSPVCRSRILEYITQGIRLSDGENHSLRQQLEDFEIDKKTREQMQRMKRGPSAQHRAECDCPELRGGKCLWPQCEPGDDTSLAAGGPLAPGAVHGDLNDPREEFFATGGFVPAGKPYRVGEQPIDHVLPDSHPLVLNHFMKNDELTTIHKPAPGTFYTVNEDGTRPTEATTAGGFIVHATEHRIKGGEVAPMKKMFAGTGIELKLDNDPKLFHKLYDMYGSEPVQTFVFEVKSPDSETPKLELQMAVLPINMLIFCPSCLHQHVDAPQPEKQWTNPPHRTHLCNFCGHMWRHADVFTNGVSHIRTHGVNDGDPLPLRCQNEKCEQEKAK